jgi:hypothetical protein
LELNRPCLGDDVKEMNDESIRQLEVHEVEKRQKFGNGKRVTIFVLKRY